MTNHSIFFARDLGGSDFCLGETFKFSPDGLHKIHDLWLLGINIRYTHLILVQVDLYFLGVNDVVSIPSVLGDLETHIFDIWDAKDVSNSLLDEPALDGS